MKKIEETKFHAWSVDYVVFFFVTNEIVGLVYYLSSWIRYAVSFDFSHSKNKIFDFVSTIYNFESNNMKNYSFPIENDVF